MATAHSTPLLILLFGSSYFHTTISKGKSFIFEETKRAVLIADGVGIEDGVGDVLRLAFMAGTKEIIEGEGERCLKEVSHLPNSQRVAKCCDKVVSSERRR